MNLYVWDARKRFVPRFSAAEVLQELENDSDSGDNDLYSGSDSDEDDGALSMSPANLASRVVIVLRGF